VTPSNVTTVSDGMTMLAFVGAGIGLGFGSAGTAALTPRNLTLRPLADGPEIATSLVWKATNDTPALRTVVGIEGELHPLQEAFVARGLQRTVAITPAAGVVLVIVSDQSDQRPHLQPRDTRAQRGRGLQLVDALSRRWDTAACMPGPGKSVWAEITCAEIRAPLGTAAVRTDHATPSRVGSPSPCPTTTEASVTASEHAEHVCHGPRTGGRRR
jgi:hypothetical protein